MFIFLGIILFLQVFSCASTVSWRGYRPKSVSEPSITFSRGEITVPADYESPATSPKLKLHIRKMCSSPSPTWNIIILPGGPGQTAKIYIDIISSISKSLDGVSYCVYAVDHRGVGKSKPKLIADDDSWDWINKIDSISNNPNFPLKTLTITNAAMDVLEVAKYLKNDTPNLKLGLIGSSYGSMLAHRVLSIAPNMFDSCVLNGYAVFERYSIDNDEGFILDCKSNTTCSRKLGPNPENIRFVPGYLFNRNFNECTKILHDFIEKKYDISTEIDRKLKFQDIFSPWGPKGGGFHRIKMSLIHHTWTCSDPVIYEKVLNHFDFLNKDKDDSESVKNFPDASNVQGLNSGKSNTLVLDYLRLSEIIRQYVQDGGEPENCTRRKYPIGLHHACDVWIGEKLDYDKIKNYLYTPNYSNFSGKNHGNETSNSNNGNIFWRILKWIWEGLKGIWRFIVSIFTRGSSDSSSDVIDSKLITHNVPPIKTDKTKVYLIHGRNDLNTPLAPALREFDRIRAPEKRKFIFNNEGHCVAFYNICRSEIMGEIFDKGSKDRTDDCMRNFTDKDYSEYSWEKINNLNFWGQDKDGNDGNLKPLPNKPCND